jgi:type I restriction enzyme S subunit
MSSDWVAVPLIELTATPPTYGVVQPGINKPGGVPMVRVNNFHGHSLDLSEVMRISPEIESKYVRTRIREGDVLITIVGSVGQVAIVPAELHDWNIARAVAMIRPKKPELSRWISLVLRSPSAQHQLGVSANTTVQTTINLKDLRQLQVPFPRAAERRAIAHLLGTLDDKIEINRKQNETLEATVRALFKAWFVDFEPVRAKMKGCWQRGRSLSGFPAHLYDLFPDRLVESDIGLIPEGWRLGSLGEISINPRRGVRPNEIEEETPYIALENMPKRCIALSEWGVANSLESNKYKFRRGEILFGKLRPYFHKVGVAPVDGVCSTDMVVIAPKLPVWFGFVLAHVSSDAFVEYTSAGSTGTKMPRTTWTEMARYAVALPHEDVAASFNLHVEAANEKIIANIHDSKTVAQLRDTLLPKLISGELRVPDAERIIGAAV